MTKHTNARKKKDLTILEKKKQKQNVSPCDFICERDLPVILFWNLFPI